MSELKACPFCENMPLLDEETWVMPGCPCFPRFTRIHVKVWNCRPASDEARLREALDSISALSKREKDYWRGQDRGGNTYPPELVRFLKEMDPFLPASPSEGPCGNGPNCGMCQPTPAKEGEKPTDEGLPCDTRGCGHVGYDHNRKCLVLLCPCTKYKPTPSPEK